MTSQASPSFDVLSRNRDRSQDGLNPRRVDVTRLVQLAEERFNDPAASWIQIGAKLGVTGRTTHRWRQDPRWDDVFTAAAKRHVNSLVPYAIAALKRAWELGRGEGQAIQVLQSSGLLAGRSVDVKHSGDVRVGIDFSAVRQRVIDRIDALAADPSSVAPGEGLIVRRFADAVDADVIEGHVIDGAT